MPDPRTSTGPQPAEPGAAQRKRLFPNPFYVALLITSTLFMVVVLAYLVGPMILGMVAEARAAGDQVAGSGALGVTIWLDRQGPLLLAILFVAMLISGVLAMATDRWFPEKASRSAPSGDRS